MEEFPCKLSSPKKPVSLSLRTVSTILSKYIESLSTLNAQRILRYYFPCNEYEQANLYHRANEDSSYDVADNPDFTNAITLSNSPLNGSAIVKSYPCAADGLGNEAYQILKEVFETDVIYPFNFQIPDMNGSIPYEAHLLIYRNGDGGLLDYQPADSTLEPVVVFFDSNGIIRDVVYSCEDVERTQKLLPSHFASFAYKILVHIVQCASALKIETTTLSQRMLKLLESTGEYEDEDELLL